MNQDPLVHDWNELPTDRPMPLIERQRIIGEQAMISRVLLARGFTVATHSHTNEQFAVVLSGRIRFTLGPPDDPAQRIETLTAGQTLQIPAGAPHGAEALEDTLILDIFSPPSEKTGVDGPGDG